MPRSTTAIIIWIALVGVQWGVAGEPYWPWWPVAAVIAFFGSKKGYSDWDTTPGGP